MSKQALSTTRKASAQYFRLKPLVAGVRIVVAGGLFAGMAAPLHAELPIPGINIPGLPQSFNGAGQLTVDNSITTGTANLPGDQQNEHRMVINQQGDKVTLKWKTFNVAEGNSVQFVQPSSSAIALNRIYDPSQNGSQIMGQISANGQVYLYNQNGFVFGKDSVVDANSLVASTLNVPDAVMARTGNIVNETSDGVTAGLVAENSTGQSDYDPTLAKIKVEAGAKIHAGQAGRILLAAPTVENDGSLSTDVTGQVLVVASQDKVYLQPTGSSAWKGLLVEVGKGGTVTNRGDISVRQGNVTLAGYTVNQDGRVNATTSVNLNGSIRLRAAQGNSQIGTEIAANDSKGSQLNFGAVSLTQIDPDADPGASIDTAAKPQSYIEGLADTINIKANARIIAPGGRVNLTATDAPQELAQSLGGSSRIFIDNQALIDVSGIQNVDIPVDRDIAQISVQSFELRNSPLQLSGVLKGKTVQVDTRQGSTIIDTSGATAALTRGIQERMTKGGTIQLTSSGDVVVNDAATLAIAGGSLAYQSGYVHTTKLQDVYGRIFDISNADPNLRYLAIFGYITYTHSKWGVTETWNIPDQLARGEYRPGYIQGADAGALNIVAPEVFWNGKLIAGAGNGLYQRNPYQADVNKVTPFGGSFSLNLNSNSNDPNQLQDISYQTLNDSANLELAAKLPKSAAGKVGNLLLTGALLKDSGLQSVALSTKGKATVTGDISMRPGASLSITANNLDINGNIQISGGSLNFTSQKNSGLTGISTGDMNLAAGSVLDVSGRWINDLPVIQAGLTPIEALYTRGGSITIKADDGLNIPQAAQLKADGGAWLSATGVLTPGKAGSLDLEARLDPDAVHGLNLAGGLSAYGISQGGSLTLASSNILIGDAPADTDLLKTLVLAVSNGQFDFAQQLGFSTISLKALKSNSSNISVESSAQLDLKTYNLLLDNHYRTQASNNSLRAADLSSVVLLPDNLRQTVQLSLQADYDLSLKTGSSIKLDNSVNSLNPSSVSLVSTFGSIFADGEISVPAGQISLQLKEISTGSWLNTRNNPTQAIWLGHNAVLQAKGVSRLNPADALGRISGDVLNGGSVLLAADRGYVLLEKGALIDVSGTHAQLSIAQPASNSASTVRFAPTDVGSNAGSISITSAEGALLEGSLNARAGSASTQAGSLRLALDNSNRKVGPDNNNPVSFLDNPLRIDIVQAVEELLPKGLNMRFEQGLQRIYLGDDQVTSLDALAIDSPNHPSLNGLMSISADQIQSGGFYAVSLISQVSKLSTFKGEFRFLGDVSLNVPGHLTIDSPLISWDAAGNGSSVNLSSAYLSLGSSVVRTVSDSSPSAGDGVFTATAQWIDLQGASQWRGFNSISLNSAHDLRAVGKNVNPDKFNDYQGEMRTAATLNLQASQIYPSTLTNFTFSSVDGVINISRSAYASQDTAPLSAGGSLTFQAVEINQAGIVRAPLGSITLNAETSLTLAEGSETSVSAAGLLIPFGLVQGGLNWLYPVLSEQQSASKVNGNLTDLNFSWAQVTSTPPAKQVSLNAPVINLAGGSTIDISGGGDLLSSEFKPVTNTFANALLPGTSSYDGSFAILPSLGSSVAPNDPYFMSTWNDPKTGTDYAMGSQVHLSAGATLAEGDYTILPAYYALLPGAYLITPQANSQDRVLNSFSTSGLPVVSGYELLSGTAIRDARTSAYQIETSAQFLQLHPQYAVYCAGNCSTTLVQQQTQLTLAQDNLSAANLAAGLDYLTSQKLLTENFYAKQAQLNAASTPLLPVDSGQLSISAIPTLTSAATRLTLDGRINVAAPGGRGARMDIAANNIEVVHSLNSVGQNADTLQILDSSLNNLKVDSLFLGGIRSLNQNSYALTDTVTGGNKLVFYSTAGWAKGDRISGVGIAEGTTIDEIKDQEVTLNKAVTSTIAKGSLITNQNPGLINGVTTLRVDSGQVIFDSGVQLSVADLLAAATDTLVVSGADSARNLAGASLSASGTVNTGDTVYSLVGGSALLRVSADNQVEVDRAYYPAGAQPTSGFLNVAAGAALAASKSMLLDASLATVLQGDIQMQGGSLKLSAGSINLGEVGGVSDSNALNFSNQQLAALAVDQLVLSSSGTVNFYGAVGQKDGNGVLQPLNFRQLVINASGLSGFAAGGQAAILQAAHLTLENRSSTTYATIAGNDRGANVLQLSSTKGLAVGDYLAGAGLAPNTRISAISNNSVTLSDSLIARIAQGAAFTRLGNLSGTAYSAVAANDASSKQLLLASTQGLVVGDYLAGAGLNANTYITAISGNTVSLSDKPIAQIASGDVISNRGNGGATSYAAAAITAPGSNLLTLNNTRGLAVGDYLTGLGLAAQTTITAISGNTVTLSDAPLAQINALDTITNLGGSGSGDLNILATEFSQGAGNFAMNGFDSVNLNIGNGFTANGDSHVQVAANLNLSSAYLISSGGSKFTLDASGYALNLTRSGNSPTSVISGLGGSMQFIGNSVDFGAYALLPSGRLILRANGAGDVIVHSAANIDLAGRAVYFGTTPDYTPGGSFIAVAEQGHIQIQDGANLDAGSGGGSAAGGALQFSAVNGWVAIAGQAALKAAGGSARFDVAGFNGDAGGFDKLMNAVKAAGVTESIDFRSRHDSIISHADIRAKTVNLAADNGTIDVFGQISADGVNGDYVLAAGSSADSRILTLDNIAGLQVGDYLSGTGLAANTQIVKISGNQVTLSLAPTAALSAGAVIKDISIFGAAHQITGLNQTFSNVLVLNDINFSLLVSDVTGLQVDDNLLVGQDTTTIQTITGSQADGYLVTLGKTPLTRVDSHTQIIDLDRYDEVNGEQVHTVKNITLNINGTSGLQVGDTLAGTGLAANTTITYIPTKTVNNFNSALSGYGVILSAAPLADFDKNSITDVSAGNLALAINGYINTPILSNTLTLDDATGLQLGDYLAGAGLAANTTITGISGNTISLSATPTADLASGGSIVTVAASRVAAIDAGTVKLSANDTISLKDGGHISAASTWGKGGQVLLSSLASQHAAVALPGNTDGSAQIDVSGVSTALGGSVTLRALRLDDGNMINLEPMADTVKGAAHFIAEGVKIYSNADLPEGKIDAGFINAVRADTYGTAFTTGTAISRLTSNQLRLTSVIGLNVGDKLLGPWFAPNTTIIAKSNGSRTVTLSAKPTGDIPGGATIYRATSNSYMTQAHIDKVASLANGITLAAGVEIDYTGDLSLSSVWDLATWRASSTPADPGHLTIRATGNLNFDSSLSDGFLRSGKFVNADGSISNTNTTNQLLRDRSWAYTLVAGADLAAVDSIQTAEAHDLNVKAVVRTGTGNIQLSAGGDININANGSIYSAGQAAAGNPYGNFTNSDAAKFAAEFPVNGGNLALSAGGNINGHDSGKDFKAWQIRLAPGASTNNCKVCLTPTAWGVAFSAFAENLGAFGNGHVAIVAAGNISNLELAMPTTGKPIGSITVSNEVPNAFSDFTSDKLDIKGGGSLRIDAGGDIQGGSFYLGKGWAILNTAGALAGSSDAVNANVLPAVYSGDTQFNINAVNGVQLAGISDPMISTIARNTKSPKLGKFLNFFSYTDYSSVAIRSLAGDISLAGGGNLTQTLPASLQVSAFGGSVILAEQTGQTTINLFPSSVGQLHIFARQDIKSPDAEHVSHLLMSDYAPNALQNALPTAYYPTDDIYLWADGTQISIAGHATDASAAPLHLQDLQPASFVTLTGDIKNIFINTPKLTTLKAGRDINNVDLTIQNIHNSDITLLDAGRDLIYPSIILANTGKPGPSDKGIYVSGPGDVLVETGRNLDLGASLGLHTVGDKNIGSDGDRASASANPALVRPSFIGSAPTDTNRLTLVNATGLVVGEGLINKNLADDTIITRIDGNTVTLSKAPIRPLAANAVFETKDTASGYNTAAILGMDPSTGAYSSVLTLTDTSGLLVGEQLIATGLAAGTTIVGIDPVNHTVTLSQAPTQQIDAGALILQTTAGDKSAYIADVNNGAAITVLAGLQGAAPDYVGFMNSYQSLDKYVNDPSYAKGLQANLTQLESNGVAQAQIDLYRTTIAQYQALEKIFTANKQLASDLISQYMQQLPDYVYVSEAQALSDFQNLPVADSVQLHARLNDLLLPVLIEEIKINGTASATDKTIGNDQGYAAIEAFFPADKNWQGDLNLYFSTLQTQSGGDINLMVPGGMINAGLAVNLIGEDVRKAGDLGILAKADGAINMVLSGDLLVNISRVFTLQGGDIVVWSSEGNIDAGKGAKSAKEVPPLKADVVNGNYYYHQDNSVSGSGLRTQGELPGDIYLFAPQGVVNAAEAGIAGKNVTISATAVLGAQNIQVSGVSTGVPQASTSSLAAGLVGAGNVGANASQVAQSAVTNDTSNKNSQMKTPMLGLLNVELLGFGD